MRYRTLFAVHYDIERKIAHAKEAFKDIDSTAGACNEASKRMGWIRSTRGRKSESAARNKMLWDDYEFLVKVYSDSIYLTVAPVGRSC